MIQDPQTIASLAQYDSATIANAIEHLAIRDPTTGYAHSDLVCQTRDIAVPMVGYALTCTADTTTPGDKRPSRIDELIGLIAAAPKPVILVVQHLGHDLKRACIFGDMFCAALDKLDCKGIVTDANGRDLSGIRSRTPNFHIFAQGWVVSHGYGAFIDFNTTVSICGLSIAPGDLLHGDESGLVSVPNQVAPQVAKHALEVQREEKEYFDFLAGNEFSTEALKRRINPHT